MKRTARLLVGLGLVSTSLVANALPVIAQSEGVTNTTEGVSGDIDAHRRGPVVSVGTSEVAATKDTGSLTKILVDAAMPNSEFAKYPIRFDFYVNRTLVTSQIRSEELPGPLGIDVPHATTPLPFNYSVVATVLHPNRQYISILNGAVFSTNLTSRLDCTVTVPGSDENADDLMFLASEVDSQQKGNDTVAFVFDSKTEDKSESASIDFTISSSGVAGAAAVKAETQYDGTGTLKITRGDETETLDVTGKVTISGGKLTAVRAATEDGGTDISCS